MNPVLQVRPFAVAARTALLVASFVAVSSAYADNKFIQPTPEELAMKSLPGYPGASAVVLNRDEATKDDLHVVQHYDRIKILTEEGKKYANVELRFFSIADTGGWDGVGDDKTLGEIAGRTIHADGTVIPFTGKPYKKVMEKSKIGKYQAMVFTLPDVEVGSIIEYRYNTRISDNIYESPTWIIQGDLYIKSAHYQWIPTQREISDSHGQINTITWFPILPLGTKIERTEAPHNHQQTFDLNVKDVPPTIEEDHMPPLRTYSYRVMFNYSSYRTSDEFWKSEGKEWSKRSDSFANPNGDLRDAVNKITAGATTQEDKLHRIYDAVMKMENTSFTRAHDQREDKAAGMGKLNSVADVLRRERGSPVQLTELFVGMARAAGFKAYLMLVPDRSEELFIPSWLSFQQFDSTLAVVNVDGKDVYFDPGSRYCPYGQLAWTHTMVKGLRQVEGGTDFATTPGQAPSNNQISRVANLDMDEQGTVSGKIDVSFIGAPALDWRHRSLSGDTESLNQSLQDYLQAMLPKTVEVKVAEIKSLSDYDKPLGVSFQVKGALGTPTGKRLMLPIDLFESGAAVTFPHEKREMPVDFHYPVVKRDALRIAFKKGFTLEAIPTAANFSIPSHLQYSLTVDANANSFTTRRTYVGADVIVPLTEYPNLRKIYSQLEGKDQETVILKLAPTETASGSAPATN